MKSAHRQSCQQGAQDTAADHHLGYRHQNTCRKIAISAKLAAAKAINLCGKLCIWIITGVTATVRRVGPRKKPSSAAWGFPEKPCGLYNGRVERFQPARKRHLIGRAYQSGGSRTDSGLSNAAWTNRPKAQKKRDTLGLFCKKRAENAISVQCRETSLDLDFAQA